MKSLTALVSLAVAAISVSAISCSTGRSSVAALPSKSRSIVRARSAEHLALIARGYRMEGDASTVAGGDAPGIADSDEPAQEAAAEPIVAVKPDKPGYSYWEDESAESTGPLTVEIDLSDQTAHFYRGGVKVGQSRVSTGKPGRETPTGTFTILEKAATKTSNLYGRIVDDYDVVVSTDADARDGPPPANCKFVGARMPYWLRLTYSGVGMHAGIIPEPGTASSHGCIRVPMDLAEHLYKNAKLGTKVSIVP